MLKINTFVCTIELFNMNAQNSASRYIKSTKDSVCQKHYQSLHMNDWKVFLKRIHSRKLEFSSESRKTAKKTWQMTRRKTSAQLDQIISRKLRNNKFENLRSLRSRCHLLENDHKHQKRIIKALKSGVLCPNWSGELCKKNPEKIDLF